MLYVLLGYVLWLWVVHWLIRYCLSPTHTIDTLETYVRQFVTWFSEFLPVKIIRDEQGRPFLYRYQLLACGNNGPGVCLHRFVRSDPDRGYHDHPWNHSLSFILSGGYEERLVDRDTLVPTQPPAYTTQIRNRFTFNYLNGVKTFHRVMIADGKDAWTLFFFGPRRKTWNMIDLQSKVTPMNHTVSDQDGGWWKKARHGVETHHPLNGYVMTAVDAVIFNLDRTKVLLIQRGRPPFQGHWAFPGGRVDPSDKTLLDAVQRELREETGLTNVTLTQAITVGNTTRDPRGFCLSVIYVGTVDDQVVKPRAGDDAVNIGWFDVTDASIPYAFDHRERLESLIKF